MMKTYKAYCFDLDGTVYRGSQPIDSAITFIQHLQRQNIQPYFVTNNSSKTREQIQLKLSEFGVETPVEFIYSSAVVTAKYIAEHFESALVYAVGEDGIRSALKDEGIEVVPNDAVKADVVVMGINRQITYDQIVHICKLVQDGAMLIGTNPDIMFPSEQYFFPGCGSFVGMVANVSKVEPLYIGKPSPMLLDFIAKQHKFTKEEMVMIGDNYHTDILCGIQFGCDTVHVNTGVTASEDVVRMEVQPTYRMNDLTEWV